MGNPYKARKKITVEEVVEEVVETLPATVEEASETVPDGTGPEILEWVGTDVERAVEALSAEEAGKKRKTVIKALEEIIEGS